MKKRRLLLIASLAVFALVCGAGCLLLVRCNTGDGKARLMTVGAEYKADARFSFSLAQGILKNKQEKNRWDVDARVDESLPGKQDGGLELESKANIRADKTLPQKQDEGLRLELEAYSRPNDTVPRRPDESLVVNANREIDARLAANQTTSPQSAADLPDKRPFPPALIIDANPAVGDRTYLNSLSQTDIASPRALPERVPASSPTKVPGVVKKQASSPPETEKAKSLVTEPEARLALLGVGIDRMSEMAWIAAINDPSLSPNSRKNLIEDLNEDGFPDHRNITHDDLPLIVSRMVLIEDIIFDAMDDANADAFLEAYKDLADMQKRLTER